MQDRGTGSAARDAAGTDWAQSRQEAEKVERDLQALRGQIQESTKQSAGASPQTTYVSKESNKVLPKAKDYPPPLPEDWGWKKDSRQVTDHLKKSDKVSSKVKAKVEDHPSTSPRDWSRMGTTRATLEPEELAKRINQAYKQLAITRGQLVEANEAMAAYEKSAKIANAETLLEAKNERSMTIYLEGILDTPRRSDLSEKKTQAEVAHYEARMEVECLELLVRLLEATARK
jgi:hypothetical protein